MNVVTVCVGSSCHIKGARRMIERFQELVRQHGLESSVELKGSFCMERCGLGLNWEIDAEPISSDSVEEAAETFLERFVQKP